MDAGNRCIHVDVYRGGGGGHLHRERGGGTSLSFRLSITCCINHVAYSSYAFRIDAERASWQFRPTTRPG